MPEDVPSRRQGDMLKRLCIVRNKNMVEWVLTNPAFDLSALAIDLRIMWAPMVLILPGGLTMTAHLFA